MKKVCKVLITVGRLCAMAQWVSHIGQWSVSQSLCFPRCSLLVSPGGMRKWPGTSNAGGVWPPWPSEEQPSKRKLILLSPVVTVFQIDKHFAFKKTVKTGH